MNIWHRLANSKTIKVRFLATLMANVSRLGLSFVVGLVVARSFGPAGYGNFNFLLGSFLAISQLLNMGTSSAFYTFISRKKRIASFYLYYFAWLGFQFTFTLFLIMFLLPETWQNQIWLGQGREIIVLAFLASFSINQIWQMSSQLGESIRATLIVQFFNISLVVIHLCVVLVLLQIGYLTIQNLFLITIVEYGLAASLLAGKLWNRVVETPDKKHRESFPEIFGEFKIYCSPLVIYAWVSFAYTFADIWLLQNFGGPMQQGFYSVGLKFSTLSLIATTSMLRIFWKEIAEANERQDNEKVRRIYLKTSRLLYFVGALVSCFLIPYSREILGKVLGSGFEPGWLSLAIMFLYPVHQSLGQLNVTFFYATGKTRLYRNLAGAMMVVGIPVTYFVLAPRTASIGGLGLGAIGLALKMVILQIIMVNIFSYSISRFRNWKFNFWYQPLSIGLLLGCSFAAKSLLIKLFNSLGISISLPIFLSGGLVLYLLGVAVIVYLFPWLISLTRSDLFLISGIVKGYYQRR